MNKTKIYFLLGALMLGTLVTHGIRLRVHPSWTASGENSGDSFGAKVAPAGDVNGDGFADVAVWASNYDRTRGKIYVFLGSPRGLSDTAAWAVQGENQGDEYGHSFGTTGDVNGDGLGDFIVAAQGYSPPGKVGAGKAYLYLGSKQGLSTEPAWKQVGHAAEELFGDCSGRAGDINGDGLSDVVIGAYGFDHFRGAAYLFYGSKTSVLSNRPAWRGVGEARADWYGYSVFSLGDVRHDGTTGLLIGAKQAAKGPLNHVGKAYAYYGSQKGLSSKSSWKAVGEGAQDLFGWRGISAGDVNGDGFQDVAIAAYLADGPASDAGKVYVYEGSAKGLSTIPSWTMTGEKAGAFFGMTIGAGDFNQDGYSDLLVGSPNYPGGGKIYLYLGGPQGLSKTPSWTAEGEKEGDQFGTYLANAGDVNGDGFPDVIVGAPFASAEGKKAGKVYLFYGGKNGQLSTYPP